MIAFAWRKHATTIVLSVLAVAGAVVVAKVERGSVTTDEAEARKRNLLEAWRDDAITEFSVTARGKAAKLSRGAPDEDGNQPWFVEIEGKRYEADPQTVDQYLGSLELGVFERRVPPESVDRAAFRLTDPGVSVAVTMDGRTRRVVIGGEAPTPPGAAYAEADGRGVVVITAQLRSALDVDPDSFRARGVVPYLAVELSALHIEGEGGARKLERASWSASRGPAFRFDGSGEFGKARVAQGAVDKLLFALGGLQAEEFLGGERAAKIPAGRVTLTLVPRDGSKPRAVIEVGAPCPDNEENLVAAVRREPSPLAACVPRSVMDGFVLPAEALVDLKLISAASDAVTEVKLSAGEAALELARKGSKWHLRSPSDRDVDADIGRDFLESLLALEASAIAPAGAASKMGAPRGRARVISTTESILSDPGDGDRSEELEIGPEEKNVPVVYIRRLEDGALLEVPAERAAVLFPSELALRSHTIWNEPTKRFRSLTIKDGDRLQRLRRTDEGGWELLEPRGRGLRADIGLATDVAELLGTLKAERWVPAGDRSKDAFGLNPPRMVIEAEVGDEEDQNNTKDRRTLRLLLGAPAVGLGNSTGSFARTGDDEAVFIAPKPIETAAGRWLLDRSALVVEAASILRATLEGSGGAKIILERGPAGALTIVDSKRPSADPALVARAAALRDALGDLMAEGAVSVGKPEEPEGFGNTSNTKTKRPALTITIEREGSPDAPQKGKRETVRILFGAGDVWRGTSIRYARRDGVEATYAVAQAKVRPLFDALGESY